MAILHTLRTAVHSMRMYIKVFLKIIGGKIGRFFKITSHIIKDRFRDFKGNCTVKYRISGFIGELNIW